MFSPALGRRFEPTLRLWRRLGPTPRIVASPVAWPTARSTEARQSAWAVAILVPTNGRYRPVGLGQNRISHLIGDSMADKFSKVKHTGVIIGREFWGFWMGAGWGALRASEPASSISDVQYTREWGEVGWGRVTRRWVAWGASGMSEVCSDFGWCVDYGRLDRLIGNFAGAGGRVSLRPGFRLSPE